MTLLPLPAPHVALLLFTLLAAVTDVRRGLIPNWLTGSALLVGLLGHSARAGWGGLLAGVVAAVVCALVPLLLFWRGAMGGGDLKLFAAIGALAGTMDGLVIQWTAYVLAGVYGGAVLAYRGRLFATLLAALGALVPGRRGARVRNDDDELTLHVRLGAGIAVASLCVVMDGMGVFAMGPP